MTEIREAEVIADYPAWTIRRAKPRHHFDLGIDLPTFQSGDILGLPFKTAHHGILHSWFKFGSVVSYALAYSECPIEAYERARKTGNEIYWLTQMPTMLTSSHTPKENRVALEFGDKLIFEGHIFELVPEANRNAGLREVKGGAA